MFLDEYRDRLERAWNDKGQLTKLHNDLGQLRFLDPACGCGNFLIVAYRELRALELEILKRRRDLDMEAIAAGKKVERAQLSLDVTANIKVTLDHFFGIEIEEWPARIAETAMLLVDHLANQQMAEEFGVAPDRLPIVIAPTIVHANAIHTRLGRNRAAVSEHVVILGNPPYAGRSVRRRRNRPLTMRAVWAMSTTSIWTTSRAGTKKHSEYLGTHRSRWAFVATNSYLPGSNRWQSYGRRSWIRVAVSLRAPLPPMGHRGARRCCGTCRRSWALTARAGGIALSLIHLPRGRIRKRGYGNLVEEHQPVLGRRP